MSRATEVAWTARPVRAISGMSLWFSPRLGLLPLARLTVCFALLGLMYLSLPAWAQDQRPQGWKPPPASKVITPCPPRQPGQKAGETRPGHCGAPCPQGMIGQEPNCSCPPGTVLAERPASPAERCIQAKPRPPIAVQRPVKIPDLIKCPPGLTGPNCDQVIVK
jgi:hypothetical protein